MKSSYTNASRRRIILTDVILSNLTHPHTTGFEKNNATDTTGYYLGYYWHLKRNRNKRRQKLLETLRKKKINACHNFPDLERRP